MRGTDHEEGWNKEDVRAEFAWNRSDVEPSSACKRAGPVPAGCGNVPRAEETESRCRCGQVSRISPDPRLPTSTATLPCGEPAAWGTSIGGWRCRCRHTPTGKERATTGTRRLILNREQLDEVCGPGHSPQLAQKRDQLEVIEYDFDEHRRPLLGVTIVDAVEAVEGRLAVWAAVAFSVATRSTLNGTNP